jgi:hypothetical protein
MREPVYETLVLFAAWTGMRAGEIEALRIKRVNLASAKAEVAENLGEASDGTLPLVRRRPTSAGPCLWRRSWLSA